MMRHGSMDFSLQPERAFSAPAFDGSMLRGAFGHALKRLVCVMRRPDCTGCPLESVCLYVSVFETRAAAQDPARFARPPHPFVLRCTLREHRGQPVDRIAFRIRLFGGALDHAPFIARAVEEAAAHGLGPDRTPFRLAALTTGNGDVWRPGQSYPMPAPEPAPPALPERVRLRFVTPTRLQQDGRPVDPATLDGPGLARAIQRRVGLMAAFHGAGPGAIDHATLAQEAGHVRIVSRDLAWRRLFRRSARQKAKQAIGGITGEISLDFGQAPGLREYARWLPATHLGKGTSMGLGHVEVGGE